MINQAIYNLVNYAIDKKLIQQDDSVYITNMLLDILKLDSYEQPKAVTTLDIEVILKEMLEYAASKNIIDDNIVERDLFDTRIMGVLTPRPSDVIEKFNFLHNQLESTATEWFYEFSKATDYIRTYRIKKDLKWVTSTKYGELDVTINLSKPEKDPKAIATAQNAVQSSYPKCMLCIENEGFAGTLNKPARQNHRVIPINLDNEQWYFQYSPYVYYNEHCIAFNSRHTPMKIDKSTFVKMFDFIKLFPHYFIGSNADLPIVGGSILTHDHFQGGRYTFAMEKAKVSTYYNINNFEDVSLGIVNWPMSVIRLKGKDDLRLTELADIVLTKWRSYTDEKANIFAYTDDTPHNTITPIARKSGSEFELDLVLRNNLTSDEHPLGIYHPHENLHHIKKENIGLIEVMGLAVLPARLKKELVALEKAILNGDNIYENELTAKHARWAEGFMNDCNKDNINTEIMRQVGLVYEKVLEDAGVFKNKTDFERFIDKIK